MLSITETRFLNMMREQARFGATEAGGVSRPSLSVDDVAIRNWFQEQVEAHDLIYNMDGAGNQSAILKSDHPNAKTLLIGSHFDSVPNGGRFDGALGVLAAFEALLTLKDASIQLPFHLEVINFTDEEGTLVGLTGSSALTGLLDAEALKHPRGGEETLLAGMERVGISRESMLNAKRSSDEFAVYIEVHIEQGTRLEDSQTDIGVVTALVGMFSMWLTFKGVAAHAGTMPMNKRKDAFWGAAEFAQKARDLIIEKYHPGVVNFGDINIAPGAFNIVPDMVNLGVEFRHGDIHLLNEMQSVLINLAQETADSLGLGLEVTKMHDIYPAPMTETHIKAVEQACDALNLSHTRLLSFAGHDAQSMAQITDSVMFFVPSVDGISHNPKEYTRDEDCINAANVMLHTILQLADKSG